MPTIFSRIVNGEIPAFKVAESEQFLAFLDVNPLAKGHTLVIPKQEIDYLFDLPNTDFAALMLFAKQVAIALKQAVPCIRIGMSVIGLEVPHAHVHLIPLNSMGDIHFGKPTLSFSTDEMKIIADSIQAYFFKSSIR